MEIFLLWVPSMTKYFVTFSRNGKISWYVLNVYPPLAKYSNSWQDIHWWRPSRLPARASKHQTQASYRLEIYIFFFRKFHFLKMGLIKSIKMRNRAILLACLDPGITTSSKSRPADRNLFANLNHISLQFKYLGKVRPCCRGDVDVKFRLPYNCRWHLSKVWWWS